MAFSLTRRATHGIFIGVDIGHPLTGGNERPMRPSKVPEDEQKSRRKKFLGGEKSAGLFVSARSTMSSCE
jgi:hypothetical protein